jgi:hypothetical protein
MVNATKDIAMLIQKKKNVYKSTLYMNFQSRIGILDYFKWDKRH